MESSYLSDRCICEALVRGEEAAFDATVVRWTPLVYSTCRRILNDAHAAEDATQVVFVLLTKKATKLHAETGLSAWLYQTATFIAKQALRTRVRRQRREEEALLMRGREGDRELQEVNWEAIRSKLDDALIALPAHYRDVLILHFLCGKRQCEVADTLQLKESTVSMRIHRGLEKLRSKLSLPDGAMTASALAVLLDSNALEPVPKSLVEVIHQACRKKMVVRESIRRMAEDSLRWKPFGGIGSMQAYIVSALLVGLAATGLFLYRKHQERESPGSGTSSPALTGNVDGVASEDLIAAPDSARVHIRWTFEKGPPKDLKAVMNDWKWNSEKVAMETVGDAQVAVRIPLNIRHWPCLVKFDAEPVTPSGAVQGNVFKTDGSHSFRERHWFRSFMGEKLDPFKPRILGQIFLFKRHKVTVLNDKVQSVTELVQDQEPTEIVLILKNLRVKELEFRSLELFETPAIYRTVESLVQTNPFKFEVLEPQTIVTEEK